MQRRAFLTLLAAAMASPAFAQRAGALRTSDAWARPSPAGRAGAGYLAITNTGKAADSLIAAASPVAAKVTIHQMQMTGAVMRMRALSALSIPPGATVTFAPGGYHLMLEGLNRELKLGDRIPAVLTFARAGRVNVTFVVQAQPMAGGHMGHM